MKNAMLKYLFNNILKFSEHKVTTLMVDHFLEKREN